MTNDFEKVFDAAAETQDYTGGDGLLYCGSCHTPKQFRMDKPPMEGRLLPRRCQCEQAQYDKEEAERKRRKHLQTVEELKRRGFTDSKMRKWTFANDNGKCPQMELAHFYAEHWETMREENIGYLLWGKVGTGKSYFAGCIANALMEQEVPVRMTNFALILNDLTELIFRFVYQMAGCEKPFKRLWISSMEDSAIKDGFAHLKPGTDYDPLYQSALCRAKADWLVGINATRLFSVLYHKTLTVGRVQTPTLNLLVERDAKITNFKKEKYHIVHIGVGDADAVSSRFSDAGEANTVKAACAGAQAVCASVTREKKTEQPPKLYDLTTLQREATKYFLSSSITASSTNRARMVSGWICLLQRNNCKQPCGRSEFPPTIRRTFLSTGIPTRRASALRCLTIWCWPPT